MAADLVLNFIERRLGEGDMAVQSSQIRVSSKQALSRKLKSMTLLLSSSPPRPHKLGGKRIRSCPPRKRKRSSPARDLNGKNINPPWSRRRKRLSPKGTKKIYPEIPEDLIRTQILTRLPIKSVVRFNSVCKSWLSLFSDLRFIKQHNTYQNPDDSDCLVASKSYNFVTFSRYQETFSFHGDQFYYLIGSAKGLVCIRHNNILSLWNPAIRKSKEFQLPPLGYGCLETAGLGFDPASNDYKVGICYDSVGLSRRLCYAVYSSNSDSWIHYQFDDHDYEILVLKFDFSRSPDTMVKDCPYWTCYTKVLSDKRKVKFTLTALKFDATSDKFKLLPEFCSDFSNEERFKVVNMRDLFTLMAHEYCISGKLHIYSLDEDKGCGGVWTKMYRFGPFEYFWHFRELQQGFKYGDEIVYHANSKTCRFDHKTNTVECIPGTEATNCAECFRYTPSLVFLQGMTSIYPKNQYSTTPLRLISSLEGK